MMATENEGNDHEFRIRRSIGMWSGVFVSASIIIGSGIFISPNGVFKAANGSVGVSLLIWLAGGIIAALSALCYGELATTITESGGNFIYFHFAYGPSVAFLVPWMNTFVPTADALQLLMFANYATVSFLPDNCPPPSLSVKAVALCMLALTCFINCASVKVAVRLQTVFAVSKFLAMGLVIVGGIVSLTNNSKIAVNNFENAFDKTTINGITFSQLTSAFYQVMWSYDGWTALNCISEEMKNTKDLIKSIFITLAIVTFAYILINIAYLFVLTPDDFLGSVTVASTFASKALGGAFWAVPLAVCVCTAGSVMASALSFGRVTYAAARRGHLPQLFGMLQISTRTPAPGLCLNAITVVVLIIIGDLTLLIEAFGFVSWIFYALSSLAVLILRKKRPDLRRPFKIPIFIPILVFLISVFFVVTEIVRNLHILYLYSITFFVVGIMVYHLLVKRKVQSRWMDRGTLFLQKLFLVAPAKWDKCK